MIIILNTDHKVCPSQNSVHIKEFCTTSNDGKDFMFNYVARVLTRTYCFYMSYNQTMLLLHIIYNTIQSLGFFVGFQEDIKIPRPHGTISVHNHTIMRVSFRFQEDIKIPQPMEWLTMQSLGFLIGFQEDIIIIIILVVVAAVAVVVVVIVIVILACPDARCESGQTSGSCRNTSIFIIYIYVHNNTIRNKNIQHTNIYIYNIYIINMYTYVYCIYVVNYIQSNNTYFVTIIMGYDNNILARIKYK